MATPARSDAPDRGGLVRGLGLLEATTLIVGSVIGSGIFVAPSIMAGFVQTPGLLIGLWVVGGILTLFGALAYGEMAAALPRAGGQYVFLKEAFSPLWGFLYGWTFLLAINTGFIAAVAVAFAKYLGVFL
ncbi:MAG TPA: amino acid permease, partial [Vicinamibacteria bacterium]|nr:amino acid permease [Vicinamibacteria bacterium]